MPSHPSKTLEVVPNPHPDRILDDFVAAAAPRWIEVVGDFTVRGGIKTVVRATQGKRPEI